MPIRAVWKTGPGGGRHRGMAPAVIKSPKALVTGTITAANLRLATVATAAFFWANGLDLSAYVGGGFLVELSNSGGVLRAYTGAIGPGEALDAEIVDAWVNLAGSAFETWTPGAGNVITQAVNSAGNGIAYKANVFTSGHLYKLVLNTSKASGTMPGYYWGSSTSFAGPNLAIASPLPTGAQTYYRTMAAAYSHTGFLAGSNVDMGVSAFSLKRVTAAAATGFSLRNAPALGGVQSVLSDSGLTRNATVTYRIFRAT